MQLMLDARDPLGSRCREVEQAVVVGGGKMVVMVLNKADLVPCENLQAWVKYLRNEGSEGGQPEDPGEVLAEAGGGPEVALADPGHGECGQGGDRGPAPTLSEEVGRGRKTYLNCQTSPKLRMKTV